MSLTLRAVTAVRVVDAFVEHDQRWNREKVCRAWVEIKAALESPVQAWGCWLKPWYAGAGYRRGDALTVPFLTYWAGARCALGCHGADNVIAAEALGSGSEILDYVAQELIARVAMAHALGDPAA